MNPFNLNKIIIFCENKRQLCLLKLFFNKLNISFNGEKNFIKTRWEKYKENTYYVLDSNGILLYGYAEPLSKNFIINDYIDRKYTIYLNVNDFIIKTAKILKERKKFYF